MGIDPMADAAGQQGFSPYHAMACNPSTMVDPLGLFATGPAHEGMYPRKPGMAPVPLYYILLCTPPSKILDMMYGSVFYSADQKMEEVLAGFYSDMAAHEAHDKAVAARYKEILYEVTGGAAARTLGKEISNSISEQGAFAWYINPNGGNGNGGSLALQSDYVLSKIPIASVQLGNFDCVYTVLSMASQIYGDNYYSPIDVKALAVLTNLGDANLGIQLGNVEALAKKLGFNVNVISSIINTKYTNNTDYMAVSFKELRRAHNEIQNNSAVIFLEPAAGMNYLHATLIYKSEFWASTNQQPEFRLFGINTASGNYSQFKVMSASSGYWTGFMFSVYK